MDMEVTRPARLNTRIIRFEPPSRPKYSFIIPIYDRTRVVHESILSCLNQTTADFEVIVVLDGSPAETISTVSAIRDKRLRVFSYGSSFGTACRARNRAILEA